MRCLHWTAKRLGDDLVYYECALPKNHPGEHDLIRTEA